MSRKKETITGKHRTRFFSIRGTFGTKLAEKMAKEAGINLTPREKELLFDYTFLLPQYQISELIREFCIPRNCHKCNIGSGDGGHSVNSDCMEDFFGLKRR